MKQPDLESFSDQPVVVRGYGVYFVESSNSELARKISLPDHMVLMVPADRRLGKHESVLIDGFELPLMYVESDKFFELTRPLNETAHARKIYERLQQGEAVEPKPLSLKQLESLWEQGDLVKMVEAYQSYWSQQNKNIDLGIMYARAIASELSHVLGITKKDVIETLLKNSTLTAEEIEFGIPNSDRGPSEGDGPAPQTQEIASERFGLLSIQEQALIELGDETVVGDMWCLQSEHDRDEPTSNFAVESARGNWKVYSVQVQDPEALATYFDDWDLDSGADPIIQYQLVLLVHQDKVNDLDSVLNQLEEVALLEVESGAVAFCDAEIRDDEAFWEEWVNNADEMNVVQKRSLSFSVGGDGETPVFAAQDQEGRAFALAVPFWI